MTFELCVDAFRSRSKPEYGSLFIEQTCGDVMIERYVNVTNFIVKLNQTFIAHWNINQSVSK